MTTVARLQAFVAVADAGSVRTAARRLVVTESAVAAARGDTDPEHGRVRVAAVTTAGEHVLPALLAAFLASHPGVALQLEVGTSEQVWELLGTHRADLAIAGRPPQRLDGAAVQAVRPNALVVVASPAVAASFEPGRTRWLLREAGSGTRTTGEALLAGWEADPPRLTLGSNGAVVAGAAAGLGVTLVSRDAVARQLADGGLVVVKAPGTPLRRPWHAVTAGQVPASTALLIGHLLRSADAGGWRPAGPERRAAAVPDPGGLSSPRPADRHGTSS